MEAGFFFFACGLAFLAGAWMFSDYDQVWTIRNQCEADGFTMAKVDGEHLCWDATANRVVPITVTYPLQRLSDADARRDGR